MRVLDIGCGTGGSAFYLVCSSTAQNTYFDKLKNTTIYLIIFQARKFGVYVTGIDLSSNMLAIANEHKAEMEPEVMEWLSSLSLLFSPLFQDQNSYTLNAQFSPYSPFSAQKYSFFSFRLLLCKLVKLSTFSVISKRGEKSSILSIFLHHS